MDKIKNVYFFIRDYGNEDPNSPEFSMYKYIIRIIGQNVIGLIVAYYLTLHVTQLMGEDLNGAIQSEMDNAPDVLKEF